MAWGRAPPPVANGGVKRPPPRSERRIAQRPWRNLPWSATSRCLAALPDARKRFRSTFAFGSCERSHLSTRKSLLALAIALSSWASAPAGATAPRT